MFPSLAIDVASSMLWKGSSHTASCYTGYHRIGNLRKNACSQKTPSSQRMKIKEKLPCLALYPPSLYGLKVIKVFTNRSGPMDISYIFQIQNSLKFGLLHMKMKSKCSYCNRVSTEGFYLGLSVQWLDHRKKGRRYSTLRKGSSNTA